MVLTGIPGWDNFIAFTRLPGASFASNARKGHIDPFRNLKAGGNVQGPDPNVDSEFNGLLPLAITPGTAALQKTPAFYDQNFRSEPYLCVRCRQATCPTCDNGGFLFGNVPRVTGELRNYLYNNEDFSFLKKTPLSEGVTFFVKVEMLNAFNRHIFGTPSTNPYDNFFGVPTFTIDGPRKVQLTARFQF